MMDSEGTGRWANDTVVVVIRTTKYGVDSVTARLTPKPVRRTRTAFSGNSKFVTPTFTAGIALREYWGVIVSCVNATLPSFELGVAGLDPSTADHV